MLRLTTLALSALLALAVVEVALRNIGGIFQDRFTRPDVERGWSLRPNFGGWMGGREEPFWVTTNSDGMRDRERSLVAAPGVIRIAVLGDSYVQGFAVRQEDTLTSFLEKDLEKCVAPGGVEVLNFGVTGYGTAQELLTWRHHAKKYRPDIVILGFYTNNDVFNNSRRLNPTMFPEQSPYFTLQGDTLVLDTSFRDHINHREPLWRQARIFLTDRFRTAQLLHDYYSRARAHFVEPAPTEHQDGESGIDLETAIYAEPISPDIVEAWRITEALLLQWDKEVREAGAEPWLVTLANAAQVEPAGVDAAMFYPDVRLGNFAAAHRINAMALAEPMAQHAARTGEFMNGGTTEDNPPGQGHWNARGNAVAAQLIAQNLCGRSQLMLGKRAMTTAR